MKYKKILCGILILVLTLISVPNTVVKSNSKDFLIENSILIKYTGNDTTVNIPIGVTGIAREAFAYNSDITEVIIPNGVTSIGYRGFRECDNLKKVIIPNSVTSIGRESFLKCKNLESVVLPDGVKVIGDWTFSGCKNLKSVNMPNGIGFIGYKAFQSCASLKELTLPPSVNNIKGYAFEDCDSLVIFIPPNITALQYVQENKLNYIQITDFDVEDIKIPDIFTVGVDSSEYILPDLPTGIYRTSEFIGCAGEVKIDYKSSNTDIVDISDIGIVNGKSKGTAYITVEFNLNDGTAEKINIYAVVQTSTQI